MFTCKTLLHVRTSEIYQSLNFRGFNYLKVNFFQLNQSFKTASTPDLTFPAPLELWDANESFFEHALPPACRQMSLQGRWICCKIADRSLSRARSVTDRAGQGRTGRDYVCTKKKEAISPDLDSLNLEFSLASSGTSQNGFTPGLIANSLASNIACSVRGPRT